VDLLAQENLTYLTRERSLHLGLERVHPPSQKSQANRQTIGTVLRGRAAALPLLKSVDSIQKPKIGANHIARVAQLVLLDTSSRRGQILKELVDFPSSNTETIIPRCPPRDPIQAICCTTRQSAQEERTRKEACYNEPTASCTHL